MFMNIRPARHSDLTSIRELNEAVLPHVNSIPIADFEYFLKISSYFLVAEEGDQTISGFLIVLGPGQKYDSENYRYFSERYSSFDYVDRIVIGEDHRGKGYGSEFYNYLSAHSKEERITCEVNLEPPNPGSIAFHQKIGFKEVNQQFSEGGKKKVSLMVWERN